MTTVPLPRPPAHGAVPRTNGTAAAAPLPLPLGALGDRGPVVLLVEDNAADVELTCMAFDEETPGTVFVARDGVDALAFLRREGPYAAAPTPDLVLLDLNLPRLDGRGVLAGMRGHPALSRIPVVVLTSSAAPEDVAGAYDAGCSCFFTKPVDLAAYLAIVRAIRHYWLADLTPSGIVRRDTPRHPTAIPASSDRRAPGDHLPS